MSSVCLTRVTDFSATSFAISLYSGLPMAESPSFAGNLSRVNLSSPTTHLRARMRESASCNLSSGEDALVVRFRHVAGVLFDVVVEEEHIDARHDGARDELAALCPAREADHVRGIRDDEPVEAQLAAEKIAQKLFREGGGLQVLILETGAEVALIGGHHDVPGHHRLHARLDHALVDFAVAIIPLFHGERVNGGGDVGIALVRAVAREVLHRADDAAFRNAAEIFLAHRKHGVGILPPSAHGDAGVVPICDKIDDGRKCPIRARRLRFDAADAAEFVGVPGVARRGDLHLVADKGAVLTCAVAARFDVDGGKNGDLGTFLEVVVHLPHLFLGAGVEADAAHVHTGNFFFDVLLLVGAREMDEELTYFFLFRHVGDGVFHPGNLFVGETEGFCF